MPGRKESKVSLGEVPPPATTLEGREEQMILAAMDLAEKRIYAGEASAQEVVHFLKQGTVRSQLENEKIRNEATMLRARVAELESRGSTDELTALAFRHFKGYTGEEPFEEEEQYY